MSEWKNWCLVVLVAAILGLKVARADQLAELSFDQRSIFETAATVLNSVLDQHSKHGSAEWADAAVCPKAIIWALRYDKQFTTADVRLMENTIRLGRDRSKSLGETKQTHATPLGKSVHGYQSIVDGSVQPYGVIVPSGYDSKTPIRLDVVLHGSTRPVGMSELRFVSRFVQDPDDKSSIPDVPYIELHPLGRVENCYRWSGETDVFEAIEDVCRRYNIDRDRIVLRGMSMGASGTWHLGLKHPDRFVALGPYCGYVDTHRFSETPIPGFVRVGPLPDHQERGLHMLDSVDYAANAGVVPAIACMGEKDVFFQAHEIMKEAMKREGLTMVNLISPGTGHVIDPVTQAEQLRQIAEYVSAGRRWPNELRFVTWTLKYNRCQWLEVLRLKEHYVRAELSAKILADVIAIDEPQNITRFAILTAKLPSKPHRLRVGSNEMPFPSPKNQTEGRVVVALDNGEWKIVSSSDDASDAGKRPGLQGPIDDAFTSPFVCVRGTGQPWNADVQRYAGCELEAICGRVATLFSW